MKGLTFERKPYTWGWICQLFGSTAWRSLASGPVQGTFIAHRSTQRKWWIRSSCSKFRRRRDPLTELARSDSKTPPPTSGAPRPDADRHRRHRRRAPLHPRAVRGRAGLLHLLGLGAEQGQLWLATSAPDEQASPLPSPRIWRQPYRSSERVHALKELDRVLREWGYIR